MVWIVFEFIAVAWGIYELWSLWRYDRDKVAAKERDPSADH